MRLHPIGLTVLLALTAAAAPAAADETWRLDAWSSTRWLGDTSAAILVGGNTLGAGGVGGVRRWLSIEPPGVLADWLGHVDVDSYLAAEWGGADGEVFAGLATHIDHASYTAGGQIRIRPLSWLAAGVRAGAGAARTGATVEGGGMASIDDHRWTSVSSTAIRIDVAPLHSQRFRFGVSTELGYVATGAVELHAYPADRPDAERSIPTMYESIGHLDLDGWQWSIGANVAF